MTALSPTKANTFLSNFFQNYKFANQRSFQGLGYGQQTKAIYLYGTAGTHLGSGNYYYNPAYTTVDLTSEDGNVKPNVRLASLGLAAKNIFKEIVVRPFNGLSNFFRTTVKAFNWETTKSKN